MTIRIIPRLDIKGPNPVKDRETHRLLFSLCKK